MSPTVTCTVCGEEIGRGSSGLGLLRHSRMHRRQFRQVFGREPEDYDEVRQRLPWPLTVETGPFQPTISESITEDSQTALSDIQRGEL